MAEVQNQDIKAFCSSRNQIFQSTLKTRHFSFKITAIPGVCPQKFRHHYWSECIWTGKIQNVLDYIWQNFKAKLGKDAMREYKYYRGNAGRMRYDEYRANGWFIGSSVIESGYKTVIGQRFKQSGMIWSLKGAKPCSRCAPSTSQTASRSSSGISSRT